MLEGTADAAAIAGTVDAADHRCRHQWLDDNLVIWDDRRIMHKANADSPASERRLMHRIVLANGAR